ncbi:MAG: ribonuclease E/G, partial [Burkholderiales bacterium]|nr:ribonuclease E/G [Burkholderiales bacterium]
MSQEILVNVMPHETRIAVLEQGIVEELHVERPSTRGVVGNIYWGKVSRVLPGMQSAFIDIGMERAAFLHVADLYENRADENAERTPIEKMIREGQTLMVKAIKDPVGSKGARLSSQLSLAGRFLVYLPQDAHIGISQKIEDEAERDRLREQMQNIVTSLNVSGGFIVRTVAEGATEEEIRADVEYLTRVWNEILTRGMELSAPALLYQDLRLQQRMLRDIA